MTGPATGDPQVLHAGSDDGPWRSADGGVTWRLHTRGFAARQIRSVTATGGEAPAVLAGSEDGAILRRELAGDAWSRVFPPPPAPLSGAQVTGLATSPVDPAAGGVGVSPLCSGLGVGDGDLEAQVRERRVEEPEVVVDRPAVVGLRGDTRAF